MFKNDTRYNFIISIIFVMKNVIFLSDKGNLSQEQ